ncbi:binuclear zinc transcription factor [Colletotrichum sojae]|uniref:Binuclear zinc transcription factor n=1 Tax=Colletotrichum sojae TaxID=2175907 RepID=A0A8H6MKD1_9PEZI|nr:binuclear zinc transcription factor [Colletotrichum sojae]
MTRKSSPSEIPSIACIRCRHRKKKCDHAFPKCGECKRAGSECVRFQERKPRDAASVPWEYVKGLELRLAQVEKNLVNCMALIRKQGNPSPASVASREGSMFRTPINLHENQFLPRPPSDDDIGLLRKADFACYFQFVHPNWCFLDEGVLREWFQLCVEQRAAPNSFQLFFVQMVCAVGALYSSHSDRGCPHVARSRSLLEQALSQCLPDAIRQSPHIRTKAYLMVLVSAFHNPRPFELRDATRDAVMEITQRLSTYQSPNSFTPMGTVPSPPSTEDVKDRSLLMHCYSVYEMLATMWNGWLRELVGPLDEKVYNQGIWLTFDGCLTDANFEHVFAIRRIQTKIRRFWIQMQSLNGQGEYRTQNTQEIRTELDQWKGMIPLISSNVDLSTNCHPLSMLMLYNFSICSLYQNEMVLPNIEDHSVLLVSASESARCFRRIQEHRPMVYCTWLRVIEQFTVGIVLLSCFWGTPYIYRTTVFQSPDTLQALEDCELTLTRFSQRWEAAELYLETFRLLLSQTPISFPDNSEFEFPEQLKPQTNGMVQSLVKRGLSGSVIAMISRIVNRPTGPHGYS